jgi:hypothetical protein
MAQLVAMLEERGLIEVYTDKLGHETYRVTDDGVRVGHMLAMVSSGPCEDALAAVLPWGASVAIHRPDHPAHHGRWSMS